MAANPLRGRTALVTGAARRLGREISLALADAGAGVVIHCGRSVEEADELRGQLDGRGVAAWVIRADLEKPAEAQALVGQALDAAGRLDILVGNASIFQPDTLRDVSYESFVRHLAINAWAPLVLGREFARQVGRGKIVNLIDARIRSLDRAHVGYFLSKHVLAPLTRMMALEFAPQITVNAVAPGLILPPPGKDERYLDLLAQRVPLKRHGDPRDVAAAVMYLLANDFVTGQILYVDGGQYLSEGGYGSHPDY